MKRKFRIHECSWRGCGCKTDEGEFWMEAGWCSYSRPDDDDLVIEGLPESGFLCPHHSAALDAFDDGEWDRFTALASI